MRGALRAIVAKELRELWRDPVSLTLALVLPLLLLFLFTYGLNLDVQRVYVGVYDLDRTASSRDYLATLSASGDLILVADAVSVGDLEDWLDLGRIDLGLILPPDFERLLRSQQAASVQLLVDGSYPPRARAVLAGIDAANAFYNERLTDGPAPSDEMLGPGVMPDARVWFNPELKSVNYIVPGLFSLILMTFAPLLSTLSIVRERERGSMQQILAAPVSPATLIVGKALPYGLLAFADLLIILAAGLFWFQIPFRGSMLLFLFAALIYAFCAVGLGLFISTVTRSQVVAILLALVVTIMPSMLFSGFLYPLFSMPPRYQWLSLAFPARYFTEISRGLALKGSGLPEIWPNLVVLAAYTAVLLTLAMRRFHRRMG